MDATKPAANLKKHGIDFIRAQAPWSDPDRLEIPARSLDQARTQVIGRIGDAVWSAFITSGDGIDLARREWPEDLCRLFVFQCPHRIHS
jgi:hypothetical protein